LTDGFEVPKAGTVKGRVWSRGLWHHIVQRVPDISEEVSRHSFLPASANFLLGLLFDPKDAGDVFLWNVRLSLQNQEDFTV
jgi:hypothetical protein